MHRKLVASLLAVMMVSTPIVTLAHDYEGHWASAAIDRWKDRGIIDGFGDGTFRPKDNITRSQFAKIMVELFGYNDTSGSRNYMDVASNRWYSDYVRKISASGIMYETGNTFRPDEPITREETAYALVNAYKINTNRTGSKRFTDEYNIATWAIDAVKALHDAGYIQGMPNGSFNPKGLLTRAEFITMIDRMNAEVINQAGTYRNNVSGNVVVNKPEVNLKNMTIYGNLYLAEGIGSGDIRLENVTVKGTTYVEGGGINSIKSSDSTFEDGISVSAKNPVRIVNEGKSNDVTLLADTEVVLTGTFNNVTVYPNVDLTVRDARIDKIYVTSGGGNNADIEIRANSQVKKIVADKGVTIKGTGTVKELIANVNGVKIAERPDRITKASGVTVSVGSTTQPSKRPDYDRDYRVSGYIYIEKEGRYQGVDGATIRFYKDYQSSAYKRTTSSYRGYYEMLLPENTAYYMEVTYTDNGRTYTYSRRINPFYDDAKLSDIVLKETSQPYRVSGKVYLETDDMIATGATIRIYSGDNRKPVNTTQTNANGEYSITVPNSQTYHLESNYRDENGDNYQYFGNIDIIEPNQILNTIYLRRITGLQIHN